MVSLGKTKHHWVGTFSCVPQFAIDKETHTCFPRVRMGVTQNQTALGSCRQRNLHGIQGSREGRGRVSIGSGRYRPRHLMQFITQTLTAANTFEAADREVGAPATDARLAL